ncbi:DUF1003 domain-containing protein [Rhizobium alvei]|uniref:DUF1003 domain-containing protein n=1 Tax=Rhizobium alvei TaxID=1132659 RepID=A0ABT8YIB7_9HYPH|nr:DUF1003 domain-containing protein [Rhizobium alvei]MDO6963172.1 DUF1003 domain-containing protein [Rhizobium alvei]
MTTEKRENLPSGKTVDTLTAIERRLIHWLRDRKTISTDAHQEFMAESTVGERLADSIARVGGSWAFIIGFLTFLAFWVISNTLLLTADRFDPYPFIFLNLVLSMLAAIQAPIIMMSQNRQSERDRFMAAKDYEVNLKAEIEVLALHEKIDLQVLAEIRALRETLTKIEQRLEDKLA